MAAKASVLPSPSLETVDVVLNVVEGSPSTSTVETVLESELLSDSNLSLISDSDSRSNSTGLCGPIARGNTIDSLAVDSDPSRSLILSEK